MRTVFADAAYWIAMSNPRDSLHARAKELSKSHQSMRLVTSEMVLTGRRGDGRLLRVRQPRAAAVSARIRPNASPKQKIISEIMSGVERVRIDTERNLRDVLDKVDEIGACFRSCTSMSRSSSRREEATVKARRLHSGRETPSGEAAPLTAPAAAR
jgi:hypothetical protein